MATAGALNNSTVVETITSSVGAYLFAEIPIAAGSYTLDSLHVFCRNRSGVQAYNDGRFAVYCGATPSTAVFVFQTPHLNSSVNLQNTAQWNTFTAASEAFTGGTNIYIVLNVSDLDISCCDGSDAGTIADTANSQKTTGSSVATSANFPTNLPDNGADFGSVPIKAYITYTAGGGGTVNTKTIADAVTLAESVIDIGYHNRSLSDSVTLYEESLFREMVFNIADSVSVSDAQSRFPVRGRLIADSVALNELVRRAAYANRLISDVVTVSEALARTAYHNRRIDDLLTLYELVTANYIPAGGGGGSVYNKTISEAVELTETVLTRAFRNALISDALSLSQSVQSSAMHNRLQSEFVALADAQTRYAVRSPLIANSVDVTDSLIRRVWYTRLIDEAVSLIESLVGAYVPDASSLFEVRSIIGVDNSAQAVVGVSHAGMPALGGY